MYKLVEIFKSLQGEGRNMGRPCVFVRFAGCNLNCPWCDTDITERFALSLDDLVAEIKSHECKSVILTGGEPTCVEGMEELVAALRRTGRPGTSPRIAPATQLASLGGYAPTMWIGVETNGTNDVAWLKEVDYVSCSPKAEFADRLALKSADEVRVVASSEAVVDFCRALRARIRATDYYISPCDHDGTIDFATAKSVLGQLEGWSLSVQLHKLLGFR